MLAPHEIVCNTGLGCTDRFCKGQYIIEVVEWGHWWCYTDQGRMFYPIACQLICTGCLDTYVDRDYISHVGV